jgi:heme A synthase
MSCDLNRGPWLVWKPNSNFPATKWRRISLAYVLSVHIILNCWNVQCKFSPKCSSLLMPVFVTWLSRLFLYLYLTKNQTKRLPNFFFRRSELQFWRTFEWKIKINVSLCKTKNNTREWSYSSTHSWSWHWTEGQPIHVVAAPVAHWSGGWVGNRAGLEVLENTKMPCLWWESNELNRLFNCRMNMTNFTQIIHYLLHLYAQSMSISEVLPRCITSYPFIDI